MKKLYRYTIKWQAHCPFCGKLAINERGEFGNCSHAKSHYTIENIGARTKYEWVWEAEDWEIAG